MTTFHINYGARETAPDLIQRKARQMGLSPEQLVRRFIARQLAELTRQDATVTEEPVPGANWDDYLTRNGILQAKEGRSCVNNDH